MLSILELEVVLAITSGLHDSEVARQLGMSEAALQEHIQEILEKIDVTSRVELIFLVHTPNSPISLNMRAA